MCPYSSNNRMSVCMQATGNVSKRKKWGGRGRGIQGHATKGGDTQVINIQDFKMDYKKLYLVVKNDY